MVGPKSSGKSPRERVRAFLKLFVHTDHVLILINPDPDSMASAFAVKRLLWKHAHRIVVAHIGEIQRLENRAMMELLRIPLTKVSEVDFDRFNRRVLVDSQPHHHEMLEAFSYDAIIDHHPRSRKWKAPYVDIRPEYGATATMLIQYLRGAGIKPSMKLATALLYAIKTDTGNFTRHTTDEDVKQFQYVFQYANMNRLSKIERSHMTTSDLGLFQTALEKRVVKRKGVYTHLGKVDSADIAVQVADFFMGVYGVGWSFVSCVCRDKLVVIFRNDGFRKDAGKLAIEAFGSLGLAGGHRGAARAEVPLETLRQSGIKAYDSTLQEFVRRRLKF